jgi:hypothetical protein
VCAVLANEPYEARKNALATVDNRAAVAVGCPEELTQLEEAMAVEEATLSIRDAEIGDLDSTLTCSRETFQWDATNTLDLPIGVYVTAALVRPSDDGDARFGSHTPAIAWRIEPGETAQLSGSFPAHEEDYPTCAITGYLFLADDPALPGDAGIPGVELDVGLDATLWIDEVFARDDDFERTRDPLLVAGSEDLRSFAYHRLVDVDPNDSPWLLVDDDSEVSACILTDWPDEDHVAMIYQWDTSQRIFARDGETDTVGPSQRLTFGVFRRAQDGGWRWLGRAIPLELGEVNDCQALLDL